MHERSNGSGGDGDDSNGDINIMVQCFSINFPPNFIEVVPHSCTVERIRLQVVSHHSTRTGRSTVCNWRKMFVFHKKYRDVIVIVIDFVHLMFAHPRIQLHWVHSEAIYALDNFRRVQRYVNGRVRVCFTNVQTIALV